MGLDPRIHVLRGNVVCDSVGELHDMMAAGV